MTGVNCKDGQLTLQVCWHLCVSKHSTTQKEIMQLNLYVRRKKARDQLIGGVMQIFPFGVGGGQKTETE